VQHSARKAKALSIKERLLSICEQKEGLFVTLQVSQKLDSWQIHAFAGLVVELASRSQILWHGWR